MVNKLKTTLKADGRSLVWFHDHYIKEKVGLTYNAMAQQLNGYVALNSKVTKAIYEYLDQNLEG